MGIFEKFKIGFKRSASNIASGLKEIIVKKEIDDGIISMPDSGEFTREVK